MRTLYFECNMGAAGDMLMAALIELHENPQDFLRRLNSAGIPGVKVTAEPSVKCGITGTHIAVKINGSEEDDLHREHKHEHGHKHEHNHEHKHEHKHQHEHNGFSDIVDLINGLSVPETVKKNALEVYKTLADAESHVHGREVSQVHFHEVGAMDAVADIVGVCMLFEELAPDFIAASPINVGSGNVRCAHGILPVPAPATAQILKNVPIYRDGTQGELCTPTGAALLKHFVGSFCEMPPLTVDKIGYGMGKRDFHRTENGAVFDKANCVRAYIGNAAPNRILDNGEVVELVCNLDDMTPEALAFAQRLLFEEGALDVYTVPLGMKKGRAGILFTCMCLVGDKARMLELIFKHTTTLGIREYFCQRYALDKTVSAVSTKYGDVRVKTSQGYGVKKSKAEYEDIAEIARKTGMSIAEVLRELDF